MISKRGYLKKSLYSIVLLLLFCHFCCFLAVKPISSKKLHMTNAMDWMRFILGECAVAVLPAVVCVYSAKWLPHTSMDINSAHVTVDICMHVLHERHHNVSLSPNFVFIKKDMELLKVGLLLG